jgi:actin-like ATPase involved in cell morphogenesis
VLRRETNLPVTIAEEPLTCTVRGAAQLLDQLDLLRRIATG